MAESQDGKGKNPKKPSSGKIKAGPPSPAPEDAKQARKPSGRMDAAESEHPKKKPASASDSGPRRSERSPDPGKRPDRSPDPDRKRSSHGPDKEDSGRTRALRGQTQPEKSQRAAQAAFLKPEGMRLSMKFVTIISAMVFAIMLLFSMVIYALTSSNLKSEIEDSGAHMVCSVESIAMAYFEERSLLYTQYERWLRDEPRKADEDDDDDLGGDKGAAGRGDPAKLKEEKVLEYETQLKFASQRYNDYLEALISMGMKQGASKVLNAMTECRDKKCNLNPRISSTIQRSSEKRKYFWMQNETSITIQEGYIDSKKMWLFVKPIKVRGEEKGNAMLALSAEIISNASSKLLTNILLFTLLSVLVGVGVSFIMAAQISKPVQKLIEDMSIVSKGNLEHMTKAHSKDEIGVLARTFNAMTQSLKAAKEVELQNQAREHDLKIATEIQAGLLPAKIPQVEGFELAAFYQPSKEVGGDYYDFIQIDDNHMGMVVADVSGKGIPGSMVMTMARSLIRMEGGTNYSAADTLKKVNRVIAKDIRRGMFVTAIYMILNIKERKLLVASAGHNPMVLYRRKGKKYELINPNGIALGFDKGPIFERTIKEEEIQLEKGDRTVIYTDGIPESMNSKSEEFGDTTFYDLILKNSEENSSKFINSIVSAVREHQGDAEQHDDITISTMQVV